MVKRSSVHDDAAEDRQPVQNCKLRIAKCELQICSTQHVAICNAQSAICASRLVASCDSHLRSACAQEPQNSATPLREIFVPFEDLNIILEGPTQRVFLTREEYDALIAKAKTKPLAHVPHKVALVAAEYDAALEDGRAIITGHLTIEVLDDGLFTLPLDLAGVGIRSAMLDDKPAPLTRDEHQRPVVLLQGKGLHKLVLSLTAPLSTAAAQQSLNVTLPTTTAARLKLTVPGNVEVKGGAAVIDRQYDKEANLTRLELLPQRGGMSLVMSLNNRLLQDQRVVVARSVLVDEVTQGYERIHATVSHRVLHGAVDKLRFAVPAGFEVTRVESPLLARWEDEAGRRCESPGSDAPRADDRADRARNLGQSLARSRRRLAGRRWPIGSSRPSSRSTSTGRSRCSACWSKIACGPRTSPRAICCRSTPACWPAQFPPASSRPSPAHPMCGRWSRTTPRRPSTI